MSYLDPLLNVVAYQDGAAVSKTGGAAAGGVNFKAPITVAYNPATGLTDIEIPNAPTFGDITANSVTATTVTADEVDAGEVVISGGWTMGPVATGTSTASAVSSSFLPLYSLSLPVGTTVLRFLLVGTLVLTPTVTASATVGIVYCFVRPATGNAIQMFANGDSNESSVNAPFGAFSSPVLTPSTFSIAVNFGTLPAWVGSTAYTAGPVGAADINVVSNDSGKLYMCKTPGTSASSGGPTGTGADITDGTAHWTYVGMILTITWTLFPVSRCG